MPASITGEEAQPTGRAARFDPSPAHARPPPNERGHAHERGPIMEPTVTVRQIEELAHEASHVDHRPKPGTLGYTTLAHAQEAARTWWLEGNRTSEDREYAALKISEHVAHGLSLDEVWQAFVDLGLFHHMQYWIEQHEETNGEKSDCPTELRYTHQEIAGAAVAHVVWEVALFCFWIWEEDRAGRAHYRVEATFDDGEVFPDWLGECTSLEEIDAEFTDDPSAYTDYVRIDETTATATFHINDHTHGVQLVLHKI